MLLLKNDQNRLPIYHIDMEMTQKDTDSSLCSHAVMSLDGGFKKKTNKKNGNKTGVAKLKPVWMKKCQYLMRMSCSFLVAL